MVRSETRQQRYQAYGGVSREDALRALNCFAFTERRSVELWIKHVLSKSTSKRDAEAEEGLDTATRLSGKILLCGEPGIGKTTLAVASGIVSGAEVFFLSPSIFADGDIDTADAFAAEIDAAVGTARANVRTLLVLDDLESLCPADRGGFGDTGLEVVATILRLLSHDPPPGFAVVAITSAYEVLHPFLRTAFRDGTWRIERSDAWTLECRRQLIQKLGVSGEDVEKAADASVGLSGPDIKEAVVAASVQGISRIHAIQIARLSTRASAADGIKGGSAENGARWTDVAGLREAKRAIRRAIVYPRLYAAELAALRVEPPTGILLFGPPGVGNETARC